MDSMNVPRWAYEAIKELAADPSVEIRLILKNDAPKADRSFSKSFIYRLLRALDRKVMPVKDDPFRRIKLDIPSATIIPVLPVQTKFSDINLGCGLAESSAMLWLTSLG